jgi:hypothetical protein
LACLVNKSRERSVNLDAEVAKLLLKALLGLYNHSTIAALTVGVHDDNTVAWVGTTIWLVSAKLTRDTCSDSPLPRVVVGVCIDGL